MLKRQDAIFVSLQYDSVLIQLSQIESSSLYEKIPIVRPIRYVRKVPRTSIE